MKSNLISQEFDHWLETAHLMFYINSQVEFSAPYEARSLNIDPNAPKPVLTSRGLEYTIPKASQTNRVEKIISGATIDPRDQNAPKASTSIRADPLLQRMKHREEFSDLFPHPVSSEVPELPSQPPALRGGVSLVDPINLEPVKDVTNKKVVKASSTF